MKLIEMMAAYYYIKVTLAAAQQFTVFFMNADNIEDRFGIVAEDL